MSNQPCKVRPEIVNVNSDSPIFYTFSVKKGRCSGNCNNINDRYVLIENLCSWCCKRFKR